MLMAAIDREVSDYINDRIDLVDENGRRLVVRNGSLPERDILTGIGPIAVTCKRRRETVALGGWWRAVELCSAQMFTC